MGCGLMRLHPIFTSQRNCRKTEFDRIQKDPWVPIHEPFCASLPKPANREVIPVFNYSIANNG